jgi:nitrogen-specific signal transduction histidine kinase
MSPLLLEAVWQQCPWGMAIIAEDGTIRALNPAYARYLGQADAHLLGQKEADLDAQTKRLAQAYHRIEMAQDGMRAIHYLGESTNAERCARCQADTAEKLREPLASVYGFAELLLTQNYDDETRRDLTATLLEQVEVMSNIINRELDNHKLPPPDAAPATGQNSGSPP